MHLRTTAAAVLFLVAAACNSESVDPTSAPATTAADSIVSGTDSTVGSPATADSSTVADSSAVIDTVAGAPGSITYTGVAFGSWNLQTTLLTSVQSGAVRNIDPDWVTSNLSSARSKGARIVLKMCNGRDSYVKNSDGTFSFTKWKALVDRYKRISMGQYISDGTLMGHFLIDEPSNAKKWGGKVISQSTLEAMAKYSKQIWPSLPTMVRVVPSWLAGSSITYTYLDAAWGQYASRFGDPAKWISNEIAAAKKKGLGIVVGINVLSGGNGSSGIRGYASGSYAMSATEIKNYGTALLAPSYVCGFFMWMYDDSYYSRSTIKSAMQSLSYKADAHTRTSCRQ